jgi:hypothetical protein
MFLKPGPEHSEVRHPFTMRRPLIPLIVRSCVKPATILVMYPRPGIATVARSGLGAGSGARSESESRPRPGPQRHADAGAAPAETQQFFQCCVCDELFTSAKNVRIHFARMLPQPPPAPAAPEARRGPGATSSLPVVPVARRVREPHGANDALKAAHSGVACQWQLVEINSAARALALGSCRGTQAHWQAGAGGPGTCAGAGPGTTTTVCAGPAGPRTAGAQDSRQTYTDSEMPDGGGYGSPNTDPGTKYAILI